MEVHRDDVDFDGVVARPFGTPRGAAAAAAPSDKVAVQHARKYGDFKQVTAERARQIYGVGDGPQPRRGQRSAPAASSRKWPLGRSWTTAGVTAASLDTEAAALAVSDESDLSVFELLVQGERWHLLLAATTCICQGLLAGLSLVVGSIAASAYIGGERLAEALSVLEPLLTGLSILLAEAALVGCLLRVLHARDRAVVEAAALETAAAKRGAEPDCPGQDAVRQQSILQVTLGTTSALANTAVLLLCLLGQRNDSRRVSGYVPWTNRTIADSDEEVWDPSRAFLLLSLRAGFGLFALGPTLWDLQLLVLPALSPSGLTYASGHASGGPF